MKFKILFLFSIFYLPFSILYFSPATADTIITDEDKEVKGIVVEDYKDRLVFSTADGEITIMKQDVRELYYDSEEENLLKLAEQARERQDYVKSFVYYDKALRVNPQSKRALEGVVFLQGYLFRKEQVQKEEDVKKREMIENYGVAVSTEPGDEEKAKETAEKLRRTTGLTLKIENALPVVESVGIESSAKEAGIKKGDRLIAVWSKLTGYLSLAEVTEILLDKPSLELKCAIERNLNLKTGPGGAVGASFAMEFDGLTVSSVREEGPAFNAGLKKADLVTAINGVSTRYMPLREAVNNIRQSRNGNAVLTVRREALIWRKD